MGSSSGGGLLGGVGEVLFGDGGASAAGNAAMAQQSEASRQYRDISGRVNTAMSDYDRGGAQLDKATISGLMQLEKDLGNQEKNLSRQEQLVSQIDPTIIEASQQALRLLKGEQAASMGPLKAQRDQQRQKLVNSLREQLGPGAETSSAGIQALTRFDSESSNLYAGAQQQAIQGLGNTAQQFTSTRPDMFREIMGLSSLGQQKYQLGANQANYTMGRANLGLQGAQVMQGAGQNMIQSAGAQYTADTIRGQNAASFGKSLISAGATLGAGALAGKAAGVTDLAKEGVKAAGFAGMRSDRRLKKNIVKKEVSFYRDVPTYEFEYINPAHGTGRLIGVMAQDLLEIDPNHPAVIFDGEYYNVHYGMLELA